MDMITADMMLNLSAVCYQSENDVRLFKTEFKLAREVEISGDIEVKWDGDAKVNLTFKKLDAPSNWPKILVNSDEERANDDVPNTYVWRQVHYKY